MIEHQFPTSGGGDAPPWLRPRASALRDKGWGPRVQLLVGVVTDLLVRDVDEAAGIFAMWPGV
jgi:hypothetical protein